MQLFEFTVTLLFDLFPRFLLFFQWPQHGVWSILDLMGLLWSACALLHVCVIILAQSTHLFKTHLLFVCPALVFGHTLHLCPENNNSCCHPISDICQKQILFFKNCFQCIYRLLPPEIFKAACKWIKPEIIFPRNGRRQMTCISCIAETGAQTTAYTKMSWRRRGILLAHKK